MPEHRRDPSRRPTSGPGGHGGTAPRRPHQSQGWIDGKLLKHRPAGLRARRSDPRPSGDATAGVSLGQSPQRHGVLPVAIPDFHVRTHPPRAVHPIRGRSWTEPSAFRSEPIPSRGRSWTQLPVGRKPQPPRFLPGGLTRKATGRRLHSVRASSRHQHLLSPAFNVRCHRHRFPASGSRHCTAPSAAGTTRSVTRRWPGPGRTCRPAPGSAAWCTPRPPPPCSCRGCSSRSRSRSPAERSGC